MGPHKNVSPTVFYISLMAISSFSPTLHLIRPQILLTLLSNYSQNLKPHRHPVPLPGPGQLEHLPGLLPPILLPCPYSSPKGLSVHSTVIF